MNAGVSLRELARRIEMPHTTYAHYEDPDRFKSKYLPMEIAVKIARALELEGASSQVIALTGSKAANSAKRRLGELAEANADLGRDTSLLDKISSRPDFEEDAPVIRRVENGEKTAPGTPLVPVYAVAASAGHGALIGEEEQVHSLSFPPEYLRKLTTSKPEHLSIISVKGDSMEPTLLDDDIVLLDRSKTHLGYDGLFVLRFNDTLHVKRVGLSPKKGCVRVLSDNREVYPAIDVALEDIEAVGKVLWYGRKV